MMSALQGKNLTQEVQEELLSKVRSRRDLRKLKVKVPYLGLPPMNSTVFLHPVLVGNELEQHSSQILDPGPNQH